MRDDYRHVTRFAQLNGEQFFTINSDLKKICVDFKCGKKIIEFNGDYWHVNPLKYSSTDMIHGTMAENIWKTDETRCTFLQQAGYDVMVIWESEYKKQPTEVLKQCIKFINNE